MHSRVVNLLRSSVSVHLESLPDVCGPVLGGDFSSRFPRFRHPKVLAVVIWLSSLVFYIPVALIWRLVEWIQAFGYIYLCAWVWAHWNIWYEGLLHLLFPIHLPDSSFHDFIALCSGRPPALAPKSSLCNINRDWKLTKQADETDSCAHAWRNHRCFCTLLAPRVASPSYYCISSRYSLRCSSTCNFPLFLVWSH